MKNQPYCKTAQILKVHQK